MYLTQGLHRAVQQRPDSLSTVNMTRRRTWSRCLDRVSRLASALRGRGVGPGDRVAILALNSDHLNEMLLAVAWADAVFVPVNTRWSAAEVSFALSDSGARVLFADDAFRDMAAELGELLPRSCSLLGCDDVEDLIAGHDPIPDSRRGADSLAGIFYTGGTTGHPKGVMLSHANLVVSALGTAALEGFVVPGGVSLHVAPMFHVAGFAMWLSRTLLGGTHVMLPAFDPAEIARAIEVNRVTDTLMVPSMIQMFLDSPASKDADLGSLRRVVYGASPISEALLERALARLPNAQFVQAYGMTELGPCASVLTPADHTVPRLRRSAGRALPHAEIRIVNEAGVEVPPGTEGELICRGAHVMLGYWNQPELSADAVRDGWMHTGDGARMDKHGYVFILDRIKDVIISGGENVYSVEVENALAKHPAVAACAVIGVPDLQWGERVHAVVVPKAGVAPTLGELAAFARQTIAGYKVPRSVDLVESLPLSPAGKVLKRELRAAFAS